MAVEYGGPNHRGYRSFFWPVVLIGVGLVWLLVNLGIVSPAAVSNVLRLWPLLLIVIGLDMIIGRGSPWVGLALGLLLVAAVVGLLVFGPQLGLSTNPELVTETFTEPVNGATSADVTLDLSMFRTELSALQGGDTLFEANITHLGNMVFTTSGNASRRVSLSQEMGPNAWVGPSFFLGNESVWDIRLNPTVPTSLSVDGGSGSSTLDLSQITLTRFELDSGSGSVKLRLPDEGGYEASVNSGSGSVDAEVRCGGEITLRLDGGSGSREITVVDCPVRIEVNDTGSGSINLPRDLNLVSGERGEEGVWESSDYASAANRILILVDDQGSGSLNIR